MSPGHGFGDLHNTYSDPVTADIAVVPVPYDGTSTWLKGADRGPEAIISASANMELYDIETGTEVYRRGIFTDREVTPAPTPEEMADRVYSRILSHLDAGHFTVTIGGEHSVSIGAISAHADRFDRLSVLQLDAHSDTRESYEGSRFNHACVMSRARERCPIVQAGIRSMDSSEISGTCSGRIFYAHEIRGTTHWHDAAISGLTDEVYLTLDLDVFDVSLMPATGTPEPGGLDWYDVTRFLRAVSSKRKIVGFDVVEFRPFQGSEPYAFLAAKLIYTILSYIYDGEK